MHADSLYEYARMRQLEADPSIKSFKRATDRIAYGDGHRHYVPDLSILYNDGRVVIEEIKPAFKLDDPVVQEKAAAAERFYAGKGKEFRIATEHSIGIDAFNINAADIPVDDLTQSRVKGSLASIKSYLRKSSLSEFSLGWGSVGTEPGDDPNSAGQPTAIYKNGTILANRPALRAIGSTWGHPNIAGVRLRPAHIGRVVDYLRQDPANAEVADLLEAHAGEDLAIASSAGSLEAAKRGIRHERFHQTQSALMGHLGEMEQKFLNHPLANQASKTLAQLGYTRNQHALEIGAHLASGDYLKLGLTRGEAMELFRLYRNALVAVHGKNVDNVIGEGIVPTMKRVINAAGQQDRENAGRVERDRGEPKGGLRSGKWEGSRLRSVVQQDVSGSPAYSRSADAGKDEAVEPRLSSESGATPMLLDVAKGISAGINIIRDEIIPAGTLVRNQGPAGQRIMDLIDRANDTGEVEAGKRLAELMDTGLKHLSRDENFLLMNVLQGDVNALESQPEDVQDKVFGVATVIRAMLDKMGALNAAEKVQVSYSKIIYPGDEIPAGIALTKHQEERLAAGRHIRIDGKRDFIARQNYFPHVIKDVSNMKSGKLRDDIIRNILDQCYASDAEEAASLLDAYIRFIEDGGREKILLAHLVESGQAQSEAEARVKLNRFRQRTIKRSGSMEHAREIDLPFYDPSPARVLPTWIAQNSIRLAHIQILGQENQHVNALVSRVAKADGDPELVRRAVDVILNVVNNAETNGAKISRFLRMLMGFKLGLSAIPNAFQSLNTLLGSDLHSTLYGVGRYATKAGRRFGVESGASLESTINESLRHAGAGDNALGLFLRANLFSATERMNRIIAANAGAKYGQKLFAAVMKNPNDAYSRERLEEFQIDVDAALRRGALSPDDILLFAKRFVDMTQFRTRPQDIPLWASSNTGKVFFQFKGFIYGQTRLLHHELIAAGGGGGKPRNLMRVLRSLLILAIIFPMAGEVIQDIRALLKGQKRKTHGLDRYLDDIAQAGTAGILGDLVQASHYQGGIIKWVAGPSVSELADWGQRLLNPPRKRTLLRAAFREVPGFGPLLVDRVFPLDNPPHKEE